MRRTLAARRLVREIGREPALDLLDRASFAARIAGDLIVPQAADREVPRLRVCEIQAADACGRQHRGVLGQRQPDVARLEQVEQLELLAVCVIDLGLFIAWWNDTSSAPTTGLEFGFASLAQILLILGGTVASSGIIARFVRRNGAPTPEHSAGRSSATTST